MMSHIRQSCFIAMTLALLPCSVDAAPKVPEGIKKTIRERVSKGVAPSVVVGIIDETGETYFSHGHISVDNRTPVNEDSIYEIGSITKVFTSIVLADLVIQGKVALDDPVEKHLPVDVTVPSRNGKKITLVSLSRHHSGLPRNPSNLKPKDSNNPYVDYTPKHLYEFLSNHRLTREVGEQFEYSNVGAGLLGHALTRVTGKSYEAMVYDRICEPLGMQSTTVTLSPKLKARLALGHNNNKVVSSWDWDPTAQAGAGALRSSARDMLRFLGANLGLFESSIYPAMKRTHQPGIDQTGRKMNIGLGWGPGVIFRWDRGGVADMMTHVSHNGGTTGYHAYCGMALEKKVGVVVLTNAGLTDTAGEGMDSLGVQILRSYPRFRQDLRPTLVSYTSIDAVFEAAVPILDTDAEWRFFRGTLEPSPEWTREDFDDSGWESGPSGFGYLREGAPATHLEGMKGAYTTLYLRRRFELPDPGAWSGIALELDLDGGVVAYLNGVEIGRVGAGEVGSPLGFDAVASNTKGNRAVINIDARSFSQGRNVLALHGLNRSSLSNDFLIKPALLARPRPGSAFDRERFSAFPSRRTRRRLAYFEGRLRQRSGDMEAAAAIFRGLVERDRESREPAPVRRLAECLRALGEAAVAEEIVREYLARSPLESKELWSLWASIGLTELGRAPGELLASELLEGGEWKNSRRARQAALDIRWLLERLRDGEPVRINCGGAELTTADGRRWSADLFFTRGFTPGKKDVDILDTEDDRIYWRERAFTAQPESGEYRIPLPSGRYRVLLHFVELFFKEPGRRRFHVALEGEKVLTEYEPKINKAEVFEFETSVEDGRLDVSFIHGSLDNPTISAIEIEPLTADSSNR